MGNGPDNEFLTKKATDYLFQQKEEELKQHTLFDNYNHEGSSEDYDLFYRREYAQQDYKAAQRETAVARTALGMINKNALKEYDLKMDAGEYKNTTALKADYMTNRLFGGGYEAGEKILEDKVFDHKRNYCKKERKAIKKEAKQLVKQWKAGGANQPA